MEKKQRSYKRQIWLAVISSCILFLSTLTFGVHTLTDTNWGYVPPPKSRMNVVAGHLIAKERTVRNEKAIIWTSGSLMAVSFILLLLSLRNLRNNRDINKTNQLEGE